LEEEFDVRSEIRLTVI